ncbi:Phospholipase D alpha 2 [Triticum urartu]|uniref:Phospholipase D n=1 Tax=Triticum urartu TaxID=4572 RepID=M7ZX93_TRIUA|nr:Phospholipase D alpha 2 [Triticum urartu]
MAHLRLHGTIDATIVGADNLHDRSRHTGKVPGFLGNIVQGVQETTGLGKGLPRMKKLPDGPKIHLQINFRDVADQGQAWGGGVGSFGVPRTFFSQRPGCRVTLYQDAHASEEFEPKIQLDGGGLYKPGHCWEDLYDAISNARHLVYITGWSVFPHITLLRERDGQQETLGELLKRKAGEGVQVLMLVWNDVSSIDGLLAGLMDTRDEQTVNYFGGSRVQCVLCPRNMYVRGHILDAKTDTLVYSHHQKAIVVDQELPPSSSDSDSDSDGRRHITLGAGKAHGDDFSQVNFNDEDATLGKGGPREPWHDIHAKVEGPVAWDVLHNFEQRWRKQGGDNEQLVDLVALEGKVAPASWAVTLPGDQEAWSVQLFRSIDNIDTVGFPDSMEDAFKAGLLQDKHRVYERSIQDAYIHAIRAAKSFIYIENQYFIGSSFQWKSHDGIDPADVRACQLIPRELSLKIVRKIEDGERFAVYIVVPMWSEGSPTGRYRQAMLDNQRRTMALMYDDIAVALQAKRIDANPRDYLTFFCLGNREANNPEGGEYQPPQRPQDGTDYARAQMARRFMIYVHSKMMIVDDEYIIVGSANLNERSMAGYRDTEIAIGAYQPHRINTGAELAKGHVHGFRMSLWHEHLGKTHDDFLRPGSLECVRRVNKMADEYWSLYVGDQLPEDLAGHLLTYPVSIDKAGTVSTLTGFEFFPDTEARVLGEPTGIKDYFLST